MFMVYTFNRHYKLALILTAIVLNAYSSPRCQAAVVKQAETVFKKWLEWQQVIDCERLSQRAHDENFFEQFKKLYQDNLTTVKPLNTFLKQLTNNIINEHGFQISWPIDETFRNNLLALQNALDQDVSSFVSLLRAYDLGASSLPVSNSDLAINAYTTLASILLGTCEQSTLFTLAQRFFDFCFNPRTFPQFEHMFFNEQDQAIARFLYSVMWYHLAGSGWKNWSRQSLDQLRQHSQEGKKIVYIAGGSDIYQLIKHGIYNIHIIDPQLPSQPKYYTDDWEWIMQNTSSLDDGIGDQIIFNFDNKKIIMERIFFKKSNEQFKARLANGSIVTIPTSVTVWNLFDDQRDLLGSYILERRFTQQSDFIPEDHKALLISFNELFFVCLPDFLHGWLIEPGQFADNFMIYVKQLPQPIDRQQVINMRIASILNSSDLRFISLGTCIN